MRKSNADNVRAKRGYFEFLRFAKGQGDQAIDAVAKALDRFEVSNGHRPFRTFRSEQAMAFKAKLARQSSVRTKEPLSAATIYATLSALKGFFQWLAEQPGYRGRLVRSHAEFFSPSIKEAAVAKARRETAVPTLEQIRRVIHSMPSETDIEKRNRALIAFAVLTGARDSAVASMRLKDVDLVEGKIEQDARHCRTKFAKSFTTFFFPVGDHIRAIVAEWVGFLRDELHSGPDDSLFPKTNMGLGPSRQFEATGLDRRGWSNATPIRSIFRQAFAAAGLPYFNPHSFRNTLVRLGQQTCEKPEAFKAWSQNLGHEKVLTTFSSYGHVETHRQGELIRALGLPKDDNATLIALGRTMQAAIDAQRKLDDTSPRDFRSAK